MEKKCLESILKKNWKRHDQHTLKSKEWSGEKVINYLSHGKDMAIRL